MTKSATTRLIPFVLSMLVFLAMVACGGGEAPATSPPAEQPTLQPTATAEAQPKVVEPTVAPTPTDEPTPTATTAPEAAPTSPPVATAVPTETPAPTDTPILAPTEIPAAEPTATVAPTAAPAEPPTEVPTPTPAPLPTTPSEPATYLLPVHQPGGQLYTGRTVSFMVGNLQAAETAVWRQGGLEKLDLSASGTARGEDVKPESASTATLGGSVSTGGLLFRPAFQPAPPHMFAGTVTINGQPAPPGTVVTALVDGVPAPNAEATVQAVSGAPAASSSIAQALEPLGENLVMVWGFDRANQDWSFYDPTPAFAEFNTVREMTPGGFYYIVVASDQTVNLNGQQRSLFQGWNPLTW